MAENIYIRSIVAVPQGLRMCIFEPRLRSLAIKPWLVGIFSYFASIALALYFHSAIVGYLAPNSESWWSWFVYILVWIVVSGFLLVCSMAASLAAVMILAGVYQTAIAEEVSRSFGLLGEQVPESVMQGVGRSLLTETLKLTVLLPLTILAFLLAFIPLLAPLALLVAAWLLAYQFVDLVFEGYRLPFRSRVGLALKSIGVLTCFGLALSFFWAIPFLGLLLLPAAAAGAAWLFAAPSLSVMLSNNHSGASRQS